jgi:SAM-dependent methyltransferase
MDAQPLLYTELAGWFHLFTHPDDYADEARTYERLIREACPEARTLLELGSGGGNNAFHLKRSFACTLTDLSEAMLDTSRTINADCEHVAGDMRTLRLGRTFDAVFVHDAVSYLTSADDLRAAAVTAFVHTRPGGVALFVPDWTRESFAPGTHAGGHDDGARGVRHLEWVHEPAPGGSTYAVDYVLLLRDGDDVRAVADRHVCGLFSRSEWLEILADAGFDACAAPPLDPAVHAEQVAFVARRPA